MCQTCRKQFASPQSLWNHRQRCERFGTPNDIHEVCVGQKRKVHGDYIAAIDKIVNSPPETSPAHAISKIPVLSSGDVDNKIDSTTRKASGLRLSQGYGVDDNVKVVRKKRKEMQLRSSVARLRKRQLSC